jgi:hypothetical protein
LWGRKASSDYVVHWRSRKKYPISRIVEVIIFSGFNAKGRMAIVGWS